MSETTTWPLAGVKKRQAWGTPGSPTAVAVPLYPHDLANGLDSETYLERLADRVVWMVEQAPDPQQAVRLLANRLSAQEMPWLQARQAQSPEENVRAMVEGNALLLRLMRQGRDHELPPPRRLRNSQEAVQAIEETGLEEWVLEALPAMHSLE